MVGVLEDAEGGVGEVVQTYSVGLSVVGDVFQGIVESLGDWV